MERRKRLESGEWQHCALMADYRAEWLGQVLVERVTWREGVTPRAISQEMAGPAVVKPGYVWARFWIPHEDRVVEKYFSSRGKPIGFFVPVCMPLERQGEQLVATPLGLAVWLDMAGRVTVLGETAFDAARVDGSLAPVAQEQAEQRIRELTTLLAQRQFPPPFVRNFTIVLGESE